MSTTVTYKGNTLTTVSNATKTLKTAGKYMEDDVKLTDTTSTIVISETTDSHGGIIKTITTTDEVNLQVKTINPTTSTQTVNPDTGYDGFSQVIVGAGSGSINNQNKTVTPTKSQQQITADSGYSGLGTVTVNAIPSQYIVPSGNKEITANGTGIDVTQYATVSVNVPTGGGGDTINNQDKTVTPTESQQTITADEGYTGLGTVTVNAISSTYIGSDITVDPTPTVSGATITIPSGYYSEQTSKSVASGTAGTPSASKGTVSNHSISVTPSVTNVTGYITGGTKSGTAVTVSASELVSGTLSITSNGTKDVTNYASVSVNISSEAPVIESLNVTPSELEQTFNSSSIDGYKPVTVSAISSTYVGSDIVARDGDDLTVSGATVSVPAGYYSAAASKSVASGTEGTPTVSKGTVSNHSITVTPSVTNTAGYISGGTHSGTAVTVSASELVSGTYSVTASGTHNVTNYASASVAAGSATAPASISGTAASVSTGSGTLTLTKTVSVTPTVSAGYISSGTAGNSSVSLTANVTINPTPTASGATVTIPAGYYSSQTTKSVTSGSATAPSTISGTAASVSTGTNTLTLTKTVSVTPTVSAGYVSAGTAGNASVSLTASVTTKAAATITPTTTNQTIAAGTYLTGTQTIAGDADLVGSNILSTANIFGVQGTVDFVDIYIRSAAPTSSVGNDGDIYIQE